MCVSLHYISAGTYETTRVHMSMRDRVGVFTIIYLCILMFICGPPAVCRHVSFMPGRLIAGFSNSDWAPLDEGCVVKCAVVCPSPPFHPNADSNPMSVEMCAEVYVWFP
ncbi:hypothetical protein BsWGS_16924 [Bradybaena similaris]